ncbi:MAG: hypothetical protein HY877_08490 [Deltaproteobacteria bacterium]|nr:hypothetical protein [Deltaproteobacteria bacterium]
MKSGGTITLDTNKVKDTNNDGTFNDTEVQAGVIDSTTGTTVAAATLTDATDVNFEGQTYKWKDLKDAVEEAARQHHVASGGNANPDEVRAQLKTILLQNVNQATNELKAAQDRAKNAEQKLASATPASKASDQAAVERARQSVAVATNKLRALITKAQQAGVTESQLADAKKAVGDLPESSSGGSNIAFGEARASVTSSSSGPLGGQTNGTQGSNNGTGARAMGTGNGSGSGSLFDGLNPPSSAAYARALYMDNLISDGLGQVGNRTREGQRLMMLFLYYARMAESGDLGAMYQFMKFITYIISKDKAKQNIQVSTQLIKLQDQSRKASDALMGTDNKDQTEFTKMLQKTQSEQSQIATSQKLLADMLQEFAQVVETLTNSVKNVLDAWGRVQRTASSR